MTPPPDAPKTQSSVAPAVRPAWVEFLLMFVPVAVLVVLGTVGIVASQRAASVKSTKAKQENIVSTEKEVFETSLGARLSDALILAEIAAGDLVRELSADELRTHLGGELTAFARPRQVYDQVRYLDLTGQEVIRVNVLPDGPTLVPQDRLQDKSKRPYFVKGTHREGDVFVSRLDLNIEHGQVEIPFKPVIRLAAPVSDREGQKTGLIVLNFLGEALLSRLRRASRETAGQVLLLNPAGYWLLGPAADDEWGFMLRDRTQRSMPGQMPAEWARIRSADRGQFVSANGLFTFDTIDPAGAAPERMRETGAVDAEERWTIVSLVRPGPFAMPWHWTHAGVCGGFLLLWAGIVRQRATARARRREAVAAIEEGERELAEYREQLEDVVMNRTAELRQANEQLSKEIDERKGAEEVGARYEFIVNAVEDLMTFVNRDYVYEAVNDIWCSALDKERRNVLGKTIGEVWGDDVFEQHIKPHFDQCFRGEVISYESWLDLGTQGERCCDVTLYPYFDSRGEPTHVVTVTRDITENKLAEEDVLRAREAAETANRAKGAFLANMSHEIRTPLNAILGFCQLMHGDPEATARQREHLDTINRSGEQLLALLDDALEMSKIEAGRLTFTPERFDLHTLLDDLETIFRVRTDSKKLQFEVSKIGEVPRYVTTDQSKLRQVLMNLLSNAVKFTDKGGIAMRVSVRRAGPDSTRLAVEVEDTGVGIAGDEVDRLFELFEQATIGSEAYGGAGLGLTIAAEFVRAMDGQITVSSQPEVGSVFRFDIAIEQDEADHTDDRSAAPQLRPDGERRHADEPPTAAPLAPESLAGLPQELMDQMREATLAGYLDRLSDLIDEVAQHDANMARTLRDLADRYDYDALAELLDRAN